MAISRRHLLTALAAFSACAIGAVLRTHKSGQPADRNAIIRAVCAANASPPKLSSRHLALIRKLRVMWLTVESGAPCIDPQRPLIGTGTAVANAKAALGTDDEALAIRTLAELGILVPEFVQRVGSVAPGQYVIPAELRKLFDFPHSGVDASGRFELRAEHLTLLRAAVWWTVDANSIDDVLGEGDLWPMPMIDGKRPYGNSSYFQLDMADLLGEPYGHDLRGHAVDDPAKDARLEHLHQETLAALQVFLAHAEPAHPL